MSTCPPAAIEFSYGDRIAKRKLDESVFLGNRLHVSYAPDFELLSDTKEKLEGRKKEVINRVKCQFLSFYKK